MKALSVCQPHASLIATGLKKYETRGWYTPYRGLLVIHASSIYKQQEQAVFRDLAASYESIKALAEKPLPLGAALCVCELVNVYATESRGISQMERDMGDFSPGRFAWLLKVIRVFKEPIPMKGAIKLFEVDL